MNLKSFDIIQTCCETTNPSAPIRTKIQPKLSPEKNADLIGTLDHFPDLPSQFINPRNIDVWLPPDYDEGHAYRYAVLYMHDGQNLFEPQKSYIGVDWGLDQTMAVLCRKKEIRPSIVVGIWNTPHRLCEYLPQRPF